MSDDLDLLVEKILGKHEYLVKVSLNEENDIEVIFPDNHRIIYHVVQDEEGEIYGICINYIGEDGEFVHVMPEMVRLFILCDIYRRCRGQGMSYNTVRFLDAEGGKVELTDLLPMNLSEDQKQLEIKFNDMAVKILNGKPANAFDKELSKLGLLYNFSLLKWLLI